MYQVASSRVHRQSPHCGPRQATPSNPTLHKPFKAIHPLICRTSNQHLIKNGKAPKQSFAGRLTTMTPKLGLLF